MPRERSRQLIGNVWKYVTAQQSDNGNGGSQPGILQAADFLFTEEANAGTYVATLDLPAGTHVLDVLLMAVAVKESGVQGWAADTAVMDVGDTATGPQAYFNAKDLRDGLVQAWPDDLADPVDAAYWGENGGNQTPDAGYGVQSMFNDGPGVYYFDADTLTITITTTNAAPVTPAGIIRARVLYMTTVTAIDAEFS